jgi:putative molybdopterin biosynthesis protein
VLLDEMLQEQSLACEHLRGYDQCQPSHAAVAQAIASAQAEVGLGTESTARAAGLDFVPLVQERYQLVCLKSELDSPPVRSLRQALAHRDWHESLARLHGYAPDQCGSVQALNHWLPWWTFKPPAAAVVAD